MRLVLVTAWLLVMAGYFMYRMYKITQEQILAKSLDGDVKSTLLTVSLVGFRLYLFLLGMSFLILASVNWARL